MSGIAQQLSAQDQVEVWVPQRQATGIEVEEQGGIVVRRFPSNSSTRFQIAPQLYRYARANLHKYELVHAHSFHNAAAAAALLGGRATPLVFTPHFHGVGHTRLAALAHRPYRPVGRRLFERARSVIAVSAAERDLVSASFPGVRAQVIHNGADTADIHAAAAFEGEPPTVLIMGRLERYKNIPQVLQAFDGLEDDAQLIITGDGPVRGEIDAAVARMARRADVRVLGLVPRETLHRWLRTARVLVSMSEREAFGLVALEAVAGGASALLSELPAHREVRDLVPDRITVVARDALAPALRAAIGQPNRGPVGVRSWLDVAVAHRVLYEHALNG